MPDRLTKRQPLSPPTREEAMRFAIASTVMEGQTVSGDMEQLLADWAEGTITDENLMRCAMEPEPKVPETAYRFAPGE
jgi:hypothetical protein